MKANGKMEKNRDKEHIIMHMEIFILVIGNKVINQVSVN